MKNSAFTLIELLIVITIIAILTAFLIVDFRGALQRQALAVGGDQALALMQQARADVTSGKLDTGDGGGEIGLSPICEGGFFEQGESVQFARTTFDVETGLCDLSAATAEPYGSQTAVVVESMTVGDAPVSELWAFFEPPHGHLFLYNAFEDRLSNAAEIDLVHEFNTELRLLLRLEQITDQISLTLVTNEEE